jgi:uncharacterized protein (TIGR02594 family)
MNRHLILGWYEDHAGECEIPGPRSNSKIIAWIREFFPRATDDSTVAWCGIARHQAAKFSETPSPKYPFRAKSWLNVGEPIDLEDAMPGDTLIFKRDAGGHVGVFVRLHETQGFIVVLGGNQKNRIGESVYPIKNLLGIRRV